MKDFLRIEDFTKQEIENLLKIAEKYKKNRNSDILHDKVLITMFFNPSTRTKVSFDLAISQLGGKCVNIEPGSSSWGIEIAEGAKMDGDAEEHLKDATKVLCRYADAIAIRAFPKFINWQEEREDYLISKMAEWADKPVINMETITHPCQALAMVATMKEKMKSLAGKKFVLSWAYHPKPLNTAVANSAGVIASMFDLDVVVANPEGFDLDQRYINIMKTNCKANGRSLKMVNNMEDALDGADFVYLKSWGSLTNYGTNRTPTPKELQNWILDSSKMQQTNNAYVSHCLPLRRNMLATDEVLDSPNSLIYDEAEYRLHVQKAVLERLLTQN